MRKLLRLALSGIDGTGKSTAVNFLQKYLERKGFKVFVVWFRWRAFISYALYTYARLSGFTKVTKNPRNNITEKTHLFYQDPILRKFYPWTMLIDMRLHYQILRLRIFFKRPTVIIYDRFFADTLVDLIYVTRRRDLMSSLISRVFLRFTINLDLILLLDASPDVVYFRKDDTPSIKELKEKRILYLKSLVPLKNVRLVDANKDLKRVLTDVVRHVDFFLLK